VQEHAAALLIALSLATPLFASAQTLPSDRTPVSPDFSPRDFSGVWTLRNYQSSRLPTRARIPVTTEGEAPPMLPWTREVYEKRIAAELAGQPLANNKSQCLPSGVPLMMISASYPIQFLQTPGQLTLVFEEDTQIRFIYLDRPHGADLEPSYKGESVGHWEGNTLVVDTIGFNDKTAIDQIGMPHTTRLHVTERFRRLDPNTLENLITIEDPGAFTKPWSLLRTYGLNPGERIMEYACNENNRNPVVNGVQTLTHAAGVR